MIAFRELSEEQIALLHGWLNQPHMRAFYQKTPISLEQTYEKYRPRALGKAPVKCHIAYFNDAPFGKIQCYKLKDFPEFAHELGVDEGIGLDLFIGEPAYLHKGLGRELLRTYVLEVAFPAYPGERNCYIVHSLRNLRALACSEAAGFRFQREVVDEGEPSKLLICPRPDGA